MKKYILLLLICFLAVACTHIQGPAYNKTQQEVTSQSQSVNITVDSTETPVQTIEKTDILYVSMRDMRFIPTTLIITPNTTIIWANEDDVDHTVTSDSFDSGRIVPGAEYQYVFNKTGSYDYHDSYDPSMSGEVIVQ